MAALLKGYLVRNDRFGVDRVEETTKGGGPDCEVFFTRLDKQTLVDVDDLMLDWRQSSFPSRFSSTRS